MKPQRKKQLTWILVMLIGFSVVVGLILYALKAQTNYFYAPAQIIAGEADGKSTIKAGGMVVSGSLKRVPSSLTVEFNITDFKATIPVRYTGILPDLFREGSGVVGTGKMEGKVFVADEILAKHDENYMPPDVAATLKKQGKFPPSQ